MARKRRYRALAAIDPAALAHIRLALERAAGGRIRCARGGGEARASGGAGRRARAATEAAAEVRRLGGGAQAGRLAADGVAGLPDVRCPPWRVVDLPVPHQR